MISSRSLQRILSLLALAFGLAGAAPLAAQTPVTTQVLSVGSGWQALEADTQSTSTLLWEVQPSGVDTLPVTATQREFLAEAFADDPGGTGPIFYSQELLAAMEQPTFPQGYEYLMEEDPGLNAAAFSICSWSTATKSGNWQFSQGLYGFNLPFSGTVTGGLTLDLPLNGNVQATATYKVRKCFGIPVGFRFVGATANGTATITGAGDLQANATVSTSWEKEWKLAEPQLGSFGFSVGLIPVRLVFTLPIFAGARFDASVAGTLSAHLDASATGTFTYTCTTDSCTGSNNFSDRFEFTGPYASATLNVLAQAHGRVMLRVGLYSSSVAYVEGGLKAYAKAGLWGYIGNTCGDADGDGSNETVRGLAADLSWGYKFAYGLGGWLLPDKLSYTGGGEFPLAWLDLLGRGGSTALQPMILGPASVVQGQSASYTIKMRPCYPYQQTVNFTMAPGSWSGGTTVAPPAGSANVQGTFSAAGYQTLTATATTDGFGRNLQVPYSRAISVTSSTPASGCGEASCVPAQGMYVSHFSGPGCTGTESYYLPYDYYAYACRTWDGTGQCGTIRRTVTNYSARINGGPCQDLWPTGNTLSDFVTVYRTGGPPPPVTYSLSVSRTGTGAGTVYSSPAGINCGGTCTASFSSGTMVTLSAYPAAGSTFAGWSGGGCFGTGSCTLTMSAAQSVWATFNASSAGGCGEASCVAAQGMYVSHFSGPGCTGTESYYLPYDGYAYSCRTWNGTGQCGTIHRTVTNYSARINGGPCQDLWPAGNPLSDFVTVYR